MKTKEKYKRDSRIIKERELLGSRFSYNEKTNNCKSLGNHDNINYYNDHKEFQIDLVTKDNLSKISFSYEYVN